MLKIFISYRRADSAGYAGRIYDHLVAHFGQDQVFMDIDSIKPGLDFVEVIEKAVGDCDSLIAVIGKQWLTITDAAGKRRLDDPQDFTRLEIATALNRKIRVIPVLVDGASMPPTAELPQALAALSRRNALSISNERFKHDIEKLINTLDEISPTSPKTMVPPQSSSPSAQASVSATPATGKQSPKSPDPMNPIAIPITNQYFLLNSQNASFIRGESRYIRTGKRSELFFAIGIVAMMVGIFLYATASNNNLEPSTLVVGAIFFILLPLVTLGITISELLADRRLSREGHLCDGMVINVREYEDKDSKNKQYILDLKFTFRLPDGQQKQAKISKKLSKPLGIDLPTVGTPVKVLYRNEKHYALL